MSDESSPSGQIDGWRSRSTGKWHDGRPKDYTRVERIRIRINIPGRATRYMQLRNPPMRKGLSAIQNSQWIEDNLIPRLWDPYLTSNG